MGARLEPSEPGELLGPWTVPSRERKGHTSPRAVHGGSGLRGGGGISF